MDGKDRSEIAVLAARLDQLSQVCARLSRENADLRAEVSQLKSGTAATAEIARDGADPGGARPRSADRRAGGKGGKVSRRKALGAAAAGVVGVVALAEASASPAAAANGDNITAGDTTKAERATTVMFDGTTNPGMVFLASDLNVGATESGAAAALGGWAGNGNVPNGIYGFTSAASGGDGVIGVNSTTSGNGVHGLTNGANTIGVLGENASGTAIQGVSGSTASGATAIFGHLNTTTPGGFSAAVKGQNDGRTGFGIGVWGNQAGAGWGVLATSSGGIGLNADGGTGGTGVSASGAVGVSASGGTTGVSVAGPTAVKAVGSAVGIVATGAIGVEANGTNNAVQANGTNVGVLASGGKNGVRASGPSAVRGTGTGNDSIGVRGSGDTPGGRGGVFSGTAAQVNLIPQVTASHPKSGNRGDLYVDKQTRLWFCKTTGKVAVWHQIA